MTAPSLENINELMAAQLAVRKIRRAAIVAAMDGWTLAVFAGLTLLFSIGSITGMLLGAGMLICAWRELSQGKALSRLDPQSPHKLALNQCFLGGMLILYAVWSLLSPTSLPSEYTDLIKSNPEVAGSLGSAEEITRWVMTLVYFILIAIAIFVQGGTALYYHSRDKLLREYVQKTPPWIVEMQRKGVSV